MRAVAGSIEFAGLLLQGLVTRRKTDLARLRATLALFAPDRIVGNFSGMGQLFNRRDLVADAPVSPLPSGPPAPLPQGWTDWVRDRQVTAVVVLQDGRLRHEEYHHGTGPQDHRISWSVAKSWLSALLGIVMQEGAIGSLDDPVIRHAPALAGSAYDVVTIRQVLNMASGIAFDEDYLSFFSDINRMGRVLALGGSMDAFARAQTRREARPGARWQYCSIDTHVIGMVIAGATGQDVGSLMETRLIAPLGLEGRPFYLADGYGTAFVLGGLNMPTRDYARFGAMIAAGGLWNGQQIVPEAWVDQMIAPSAPHSPDCGGAYGYQWWLPEGSASGECLARGIYGQYIHIDRQRGTVIAVNAADLRFRDADRLVQDMALFRALARSL
jgi:CubicO group peptidase (beta-lactamase class C family)